MFSFNSADSSINIYDEIGPSEWGLIDALSVMNALDSMRGQHVTVRLNSPGGEVDQGIAIYNALKRHPGGVTMVVDSLAASMASYLLQAGTKRIVAGNAMVMIHAPYTVTAGNSEELRKTADVLDKYAERMVPDYAARSGKSDEEIQAIMMAESWYVGQEIIDAGFADELMAENDIQPMARGLQKLCKHPPAALFAKRDAAKQVREYPRRTAAVAACQR